MSFDPLMPVQSMDTDRDRKENLLVSFDGFIKNQSEGLVRTMLSEIEDWIEVYPSLAIYDDMTMDEIYDAVVLYQPYDLLYEMSGNKRTDEEIFQDLDNLLPRIFLDNSKITQFEFALFQLLKEDKIKKCYLFKENIFYENEIDYIQKQYGEVLHKIEMIDDTSLPDIFKEVKPTTVFITDPAFVFDYIENNYDHNDPDIKDVMFIILNSMQTLEFNGSQFDYSDLYRESVGFVNENREYGVATMYNDMIENFEEDEDGMEDEDE